jgi:hypothetical protein
MGGKFESQSNNYDESNVNRPLVSSARQGIGRFPSSPNRTRLPAAEKRSSPGKVAIGSSEIAWQKFDAGLCSDGRETRASPLPSQDLQSIARAKS